jgi:hypothetical protein
MNPWLIAGLDFVVQHSTNSGGDGAGRMDFYSTRLAQAQALSQSEEAVEFYAPQAPLDRLSRSVLLCSTSDFQVANRP